MSERGLTPDVVKSVAGTDEERRSFEAVTSNVAAVVGWPQAKSSICQKFMFLRVCGTATVAVVVVAGTGCLVCCPSPRLTLGDELQRKS